MDSRRRAGTAGRARRRDVDPRPGPRGDQRKCSGDFWSSERIIPIRKWELVHQCAKTLGAQNGKANIYVYVAIGLATVIHRSYCAECHTERASWYDILSIIPKENKRENDITVEGVIHDYGSSEAKTLIVGTLS
jgi:hypothetical protein